MRFSEGGMGRYSTHFPDERPELIMISFEGAPIYICRGIIEDAFDGE